MTQRVIIFTGDPGDPEPITDSNPLHVQVHEPLNVIIDGGTIVIDPVDLALLAQEATLLLVGAAIAARATEATQLLVKAKTDNLDVALSTRATEATLAARATEATQLLVKAKTDNLDVALSTRATEATQLLVKAKTDNLDVALSTRATEATQLLVKAKTDNLDVALSTRATEATQLLVKAKTDNLDVALSTRATEATQLLVKAKTDNLDVATSTRLAEATFTTRHPVVGQATMAASMPMVIASNQSSIPTNKASSYLHLNVAGTTVIKASPGVLHKVTINDFGGGTMTFYDNTAGSGAIIAAIKPAGNTGTLFYELSFTVGLTVVITGASPGDITVTYD